MSSLIKQLSKAPCQNVVQLPPLVRTTNESGIIIRTETQVRVSLNNNKGNLITPNLLINHQPPTTRAQILMLVIALNATSAISTTLGSVTGPNASGAVNPVMLQRTAGHHYKTNLNSNSNHSNSSGLILTDATLAVRKAISRETVPS